MSVVYCSYCGLYIDTDYDVEHFVLDLNGEEICEKKFDAIQVDKEHINASKTD